MCSEPNALVYFWGSPQDFRQVADAVYPVLSAEKASSGAPLCCGYASAGKPATWTPPWWQWSGEAPSHYPQAALSWHLYLNGGSETYDQVRVWAANSTRADALNGSSVTEWGLFSDGTPTRLLELQTPRLVAELARLLGFA